MLEIYIEENEYTTIPERRIEVPIRLSNPGERKDSFEIIVQGLPESWITLSQENVWLEPEEKLRVVLSILPSAKAQLETYPVRIIATPTSDPTQKVQADFSLRIAAIDIQKRIGVTMDSVNYSVTPGRSIEIPFLLTNRGNETDNFRVMVRDLPVTWISVQTPSINVKPNEMKENKLIIHPPRTPNCKAGRNSFEIIITSQLAPEVSVEIDCILTVLAYTDFRIGLQPPQVRSREPARVLVENKGNIDQTFVVAWESQGDELHFDPDYPEQPNGKKSLEPSPGSEFINLKASLQLRVPSGQTDSLTFYPELIQRALIGGDSLHPYSVKVTPVEKDKAEVLSVQGNVVSRAWIPFWVAPTILVVLISISCLFILLTGINRRRTASATQTAVYRTAIVVGATQTNIANQTAAVAQGQQDRDGDGLTDDQENQLGTDPLEPDSDGDELLDGQEVSEFGTDPRNPDSDQDALSDGDEVLRRVTDPRNPDSDSDGLSDGDEARRGIDPLNPDSDQDGLRDGDEIQNGTDPLNPDTDNDQLQDGREIPPCPNPLNPDSDLDSTIDGRDLDPCNADNPSLTATAVAAQPPTNTPTQVMLTETPSPPTPTPISLPGVVIYQSDRNGNLEIYAQNGADGVITRLTNHPAADIQPAWSPDGQRIAFTSNRDGNNEIYMMNADGSILINLTNDTGDDQFPTWSPDGLRIAFASNRSGNWDIYSIAVDGSELKNLTNNPNEDLHPAWFTIGDFINQQERIAFTSNRDGNQEIYLMETNGENPTNLTQNPFDDFYPVPSHTGDAIAFVSNRDGNLDIFLVNVTGGSASNMTNDPAEDLYPGWSPDDKWLAFATNRGNLEIFAIRIDRSILINLSNNPASENFPSWR